MSEKQKSHFRRFKATYATGITLGTILSVFTPVIVSQFNRLSDKVDNIYTLFSEISSLRERIKNIEKDTEDIHRHINELEQLVSQNKVDIAVIQEMIKNLTDRISQLEEDNG